MTQQVTVAEFLQFRKDHFYRKYFSTSKPVVINNVTWYDAIAYCNWLNEREGSPRTSGVTSPTILASTWDEGGAQIMSHKIRLHEEKWELSPAWVCAESVLRARPRPGQPFRL